MIGEVLGGISFTLMALRFYLYHTKPVHMEFKTKFGEHSQYESFYNAYNAFKQNLKVFSEPMVKLFGIPLLNNYQIIDPEMARKFFMTDKAQSHMEMSGFFELCFHYRDLVGAKHAGLLKHKELGVMRDMNPKDPQMTNTMKQARKRFLEFTSSPSNHEVNLDRVRREAHSLVEVALEEGKNGDVPFEPKRITMEAATNAGFATATGFSYKQGTKELREAAAWVDRNLFEIVSPYPYKLIFILMPRWIRHWIPLRFWPKMCQDVQPFWDSVIDMVDERAKNYNPDDRKSLNYTSYEETGSFFSKKNVKKTKTNN